MARAAGKATPKAEDTADISQDDLQQQIAQLKEDIATIAATISQLGQQKIRDAKHNVSQTYHDAVEHREATISELKSCAQSIEEQLLETVRERPIASLATAVGVGYLLAILRR